MYEFDYHCPNSVSEALEKFRAAPEGRFLAGGQTLLPTLKQRLAAPSDLVDLGRIAELRGVAVEGDAVVIGAMTRHAEVAASSDAQGRIPALAALAADIGDRQVRNRGTLGGSIANNDPAADYPAACLALDATIRTNAREIAADDFFTGLFETALEEDELITAVCFPAPLRAAYMKFKNPASRYAIVGVFVAQSEGGVRLAVTGAGAGGVFRIPDMEAALATDFRASAIEGIAVPPDDLNSDIHASAEYRAHLVGVMARRAVAACG